MSEEKYFVNQDGLLVKLSEFKWKNTITKENWFELINILNSDDTILDSFVLLSKKETEKLRNNLKKSHWIELKEIR